MKRILMSIFLAITVSMFFTGCNSLILSVGEDDFVEVDWREMETWASAPDYYEENETEKFENLEGVRAFKIKEGHSEESIDLVDFQIGSMRFGGTFIYAYSTKEAGTDDNRKKVHCVATYHCEREELKIIHENLYYDEDVEDDRESFYIQLCNEAEPANSDIFVYDNGMGYIYDSNGNLKLLTDIETFIRSNFDKAHSVVTANAITDGYNRIYLQLLIEKEEIQFDTDSTEASTDEDYEKEAERLEKEFNDKTIEMLLIYDFEQIDGKFQQTLSNIDAQVEKWQSIASEHGSYTSEPDAEADWETMKKELPDQWGQLSLMVGANSYPVYKWKESPVFGYNHDGYVCTFVPDFSDATTYEEATSIEENSEMENYFIMVDDKNYHELYGTMGAFYFYENLNKTYIRSYTLEWTETITNEDGTTTEEVKTSERKQTITIPTCRRAHLDNEYLEGYYTSEFINQIIGTVKNDVIYMGNSTLYRMDHTFSPKSLVPIADDFLISVGCDDEAAYTLFSYKDKTLVVEWTDNWSMAKTTIIDDEMISGILKANAQEEIDTSEKPVIDQTYYDMYHTNNELSNVSYSEYITADKVVKASVSVDKDKLEKLGITCDTTNTESEGYLFSTSTNGLLYYDIALEKLFCIKEGTWYRTFKYGNTHYAIGFDNEDHTYSTQDIAFARMYEFDIDALYQDALDAMIENGIKE